MIRARNSNDYLHTEVILSKVSEYDIFKHYCGNFKELGVKFCSELRKDSNPSCSIVEWNGKLLYKDFANEEHTFNCFSYVIHKYGLDFISALETISRDFGLGLCSNSNVRVAKSYMSPSVKLEPRKKSQIAIRSKAWSSEDAKFWKRYEISKSLLIKYNVIPIDYFWINLSRFKVNGVGYAYKFKDGYKIYQPYDPENKWYSNVGTDIIQGYDQLPEKDEILFITSSLKDVLVLSTLGYSSIAPQSEMVGLSDELIVELNRRFPIIVVLYDNDFNSTENPGQKSAKRLCGLHGFINFCIPSSYASKDISDLVDNHGLGCAKEFIDNQLNMIHHGSKDRRDTTEVCDAPF